MKAGDLFQLLMAFRVSNFLVRCLLVVPLLLAGWLKADAVDYYVSGAGNDAWDGKSAEYSGGTTGPWKTLNRVNQQMTLPEGATILFRRGDRFEGKLGIDGYNISCLPIEWFPYKPTRTVLHPL